MWRISGAIYLYDFLYYSSFFTLLYFPPFLCRFPKFCYISDILLLCSSFFSSFFHFFCTYIFKDFLTNSLLYWSGQIASMSDSGAICGCSNWWLPRCSSARPFPIHRCASGRPTSMWWSRRCLAFLRRRGISTLRGHTPWWCILCF